MIPECVLLLKWLKKDGTPNTLEYKVKLLGTGIENDFIWLIHDPGQWLYIIGYIYDRA